MKLIAIHTSVPKIATEVKDKLCAEKYGPSYSKKFVFPDKCSKELNKMLENADRHLRHGAKVSSFSLLLWDTLARISEDPTSVDPDLLQTMFKLMDDCLISSCLWEFAVGSAITTSIRRSMILDNMFWPSQGARERMESLPLTGNDLFNNKFDESLLKEAKRIKTEERINLRHPGSSSHKRGSSSRLGGSRQNRGFLQQSHSRVLREPKMSSSVTPRSTYRFSSTAKSQPPRFTRSFKSQGSRQNRGQMTTTPAQFSCPLLRDL